MNVWTQFSRGEPLLSEILAGNASIMFPQELTNVVKLLNSVLDHRALSSGIDGEFLELDS